MTAHAFLVLDIERNVSMGLEIELDDELAERLSGHLEEDQTYEELIEELLNIYESSRFIQEGFSE